MLTWFAYISAKFNIFVFVLEVDSTVGHLIGLTGMHPTEVLVCTCLPMARGSCTRWHKGQETRRLVAGEDLGGKEALHVPHQQDEKRWGPQTPMILRWRSLYGCYVRRRCSRGALGGLVMCMFQLLQFFITLRNASR